PAPGRVAAGHGARGATSGARRAGRARRPAGPRDDRRRAAPRGRTPGDRRAHPQPPEPGDAAARAPARGARALEDRPGELARLPRDRVRVPVRRPRRRRHPADQVRRARVPPWLPERLRDLHAADRPAADPPLHGARRRRGRVRGVAQGQGPRLSETIVASPPPSRRSSGATGVVTVTGAPASTPPAEPNVKRCFAVVPAGRASGAVRQSPDPKTRTLRRDVSSHSARGATWMSRACTGRYVLAATCSPPTPIVWSTPSCVARYLGAPRSSPVAASTVSAARRGRYGFP